MKIAKSAICAVLAVLTLLCGLATSDFSVAGQDGSTYFFYMPDSWKDVHNDYYDGNSLDSCMISVAWISLPSYQKKYVEVQRCNDAPNVFSFFIPREAAEFIIGNAVDPYSTDDKSRCISTTVIKNYSEDQNEYEGNDFSTFWINRYEQNKNVIFIVDPDSETINSDGSRSFQSSNFYYYGNGKYGRYKTLAEADYKFFSEGAFPTENPEFVPDPSQYNEEDYAVYFDTAGAWDSVDSLKCKLYSLNGGEYIIQNDEVCSCSRVTENLYKYDLSKVVKLKTDGVYEICFQDSDRRTITVTLGAECVGDTVYLTNEMFAYPDNPYVDYYVCKWRKNSGKYGFPYGISLKGDVYGECFRKGENKNIVIARWVFQNLGPNSKKTDALEKVYRYFNISTEEESADIFDRVLLMYGENLSSKKKELYRNIIVKSVYNAFPYLPEPEDFPNVNSVVKLSDATTVVGGLATVNVSISDNPGLTGASLEIRFNRKVMKLIEVQDGEILGKAVHSNDYDVPYKLLWENDNSKTDFKKNGVIARLTFRVFDSTDAGDYPVQVYYNYENSDIINAKAKKVKLNLRSSSIKVTEDYLPGDINGDGVVNNIDRAVLTRYVAGWDDYQEIVKPSADLDNDRKITALDRVILSRHLANWSGFESLPYNK